MVCDPAPAQAMSVPEERLVERPRVNAQRPLLPGAGGAVGVPRIPRETQPPPDIGARESRYAPERGDLPRQLPPNQRESDSRSIITHEAQAMP